MIKKIIGCETPHKSYRLWIYFDEINFQLVNQLSFLSIWPGPDKVDGTMYSFEFELRFKDFLEKKFKYYMAG